jgi:hypothetical protein
MYRCDHGFRDGDGCRVCDADAFVPVEDLNEAREQIDALTARVAELEAAVIGWTGYAWKDGVYVDSLAEYFGKLAGADGEKP